MTLRLIPILLFSFALPAMAEDAAMLEPRPADSVVLAEHMYVKRPVVVFADNPNDPAFIRQMELIAAGMADLAERDVIIVTDTDPAGMSEWRKRLRPRGFSLVLMDKDLRTTIRKPLPWDAREITHAIDKFPIRREEMRQKP